MYHSANIRRQMALFREANYQQQRARPKLSHKAHKSASRSKGPAMKSPQERCKDLDDAVFLFAFKDNKTITSREVGPVVRSCGFNPSEEDLKEICQIVESKYKNKIDAVGLAEVLIPRSEHLCTSYEELLDALQLFDKQGNGMINVSDCRHAVITLGEGIVPALVDEILRVVNPDQEDYVKAEDFAKCLLMDLGK